jgi:hypothetical protein
MMHAACMLNLVASKYFHLGRCVYGLLLAVIQYVTRVRVQVSNFHKSKKGKEGFQ